MDYVTSRRGKGLSNEPMEVSYEDIMRIWRISDEEAELVRRVTESGYRGESYYPDGKPGIVNWRMSGMPSTKRSFIAIPRQADLSCSTHTE